MKKTLLAIAAMVAMVACNNDYVVKEAAPEAISFDNVFVDNATRSVNDPSYTNTKLFSNFQVYGYVEGQPLFNAENSGVTVSGSGLGESGSWTYTGTQYWIPGAEYNFSAVAPATGWTKTAANATSTTLSFTNDGKHDLLYAQTAAIEGQESGSNEKVAFTFRHILSKVKFSFENAYNATNTVLQVRDIMINNAYANGSVVLTDTDTNWTVLANSNTLDLSFGNANTTSINTDAQTFAYEAEVESHEELLLIPFEYTDSNKLNITFEYDIVVSGEVVATFPVTSEVAVNLEPGKAYDFKATITPGDPIVFTVTTVNDWVNGTI